MPILPGTDGVRKMSKSLDNYIAVEEAPGEMFGKVMSLPDTMIVPYMELLTDIPGAEIEEIRQSIGAPSCNPMDSKKRLGEELVAIFHDSVAARQARENFERVVQRKEAPEEAGLVVTPVWVSGSQDGAAWPDIHVQMAGGESFALDMGQQRNGGPPVSIDVAAGAFLIDLGELLTRGGIAPSKGQVKRLLAQGGIEVAGSKIDSIICAVSPGDLVKAGKRDFIRIAPAPA
jgi:tyrosyl-tRNA synthetase